MNWLKYLFSRRKLHSELAEEIREHLEEKIEELVESGMSREEAAYAARREFGNVTLLEESGREVWRWAPVEDFLMDVRFGLRLLRKNPGFTAVAVMTLALGIAVNTTIFSAVNGWMLRRPHMKDPGRVVVILTTDLAKEGWGWDRQPVSPFDFVAWQKQNQTFQGMAASERGDFALTGGGEPEPLSGMRVSANYFDLLGVSAALGRTFLPDEDQSGRNRVVILSNGLWQRRFGSNPEVIGQVVRLNGEDFMVVGVMSSSYRIDVYGGPQLWTPLVFPPESFLPAARGNRSLEVMARLKPGATVETARAEMVALAQQSEQAYPGTYYPRIVTFTVEGRPALSRSERTRTEHFVISPDYLLTLGIPLIRGRNFSSSDNAQALPVALVNQEFVRRYFPNEEPVGKRIRLDTSGLDRPDWSEIVGVVGNVRDSFEQRKYVPQAYEPYRQQLSPVMTFVVRTKSDLGAFAPMLRRAVWEVDKDQPITAVQTMNQVMDESGAAMRVVNIIMSTFAGLGLVLAAVGVFGVMAYTVAQRTHEIGIRMALGARRSDVLRMVVKKGMVLGAVGVASGLVLAVPLTWLKLGLVNDDFLPFDQRVPVFLAAVFVISLAALLASYIPARRATRVDPAIALRHE